MSTLIPVYDGPALPGSGDVGAAATEQTVNIGKFKGAATLRSQQYTATSTVGRALGGNPSRRTVTIQNLGSNDVYVGGEEVSTSTGLKIAANEKITLEIRGDVYLVTASTSEDCRLLEETDA